MMIWNRYQEETFLEQMKFQFAKFCEALLSTQAHHLP